MKKIITFASLAVISTCQIALAESYDVEISAQVGSVCVLPTPTSSDTALSGITESKSDFTAAVGPDGKTLFTTATLTFTDAYCNGAATLTLESLNLGGGLKPMTAAPTGFANTIDYVATADWGTGNQVVLTPADSASSFGLTTSSENLTLKIDVYPSDLPLTNGIYTDTVTMTIAVN
jgi:hypothetical protein